jgi:hypothetical protein
MYRPMTNDFYTPDFAPWRARLAAHRRALPRTDSPQPILHQLEALFRGLIPHHWLCPTDEGTGSRQRQWPLRLTFWTFLAQLLCPGSGSACRAAVEQAQAQARLEGRPIPNNDTSAYCQARLRWPLEKLREFLEKVGATLEQRVPSAALWCGRVVKIIDGTTLTALDTPANQKVFPQPATQKAGCGFPLLRLVGLFSLASGALLGYATGAYTVSELSLAASLWELLDPRDVLLGDRLFGCYRVIASVVAQHADVVGRLHASRKADFRRGQRLGRHDRLVEWKRPGQVPPGLSLAQWLALPATLTLRLVRFQIVQKGCRTKSITLVTTLLDPQQYPVSALAQLYARRWGVELSFRQIKTALAMDHLEVRSPAMIERSVAMHLLSYQLIRGLMQEAALTWDVPLRQISFQGALDASRHYGEALLRARSKFMRLRLLADLLRRLAADAVPERPNRAEPRAIKRNTKHFPKLTCPRRRFREIPHRHRVLARRAKARRNRALI